MSSTNVLSFFSLENRTHSRLSHSPPSSAKTGGVNRSKWVNSYRHTYIRLKFVSCEGTYLKWSAILQASLPPLSKPRLGTRELFAKEMMTRVRSLHVIPRRSLILPLAIWFTLSISKVHSYAKHEYIVLSVYCDLANHTTDLCLEIIIDFCKVA